MSAIAAGASRVHPHSRLRRIERLRLQQAMDRADSYAAWIDAAQRYDRLTGRARWRERSRSGLYDYRMIADKLRRLSALLEKDDVAGLMFEIEEGVHGNLGGMGKPILYAKAKSGTKRLISDYVDAVTDALLRIERATVQEASSAARHDLMLRAGHCYGRTALMMSSGGTLMYFHFGVAKALFGQGLLPDIISGSSAGGIVAAVVGTRTDAELRQLFASEQIYFGDQWQPNRLERWTGLRRLYRADAFEQTFDRLIPDLTFREAYERSGRSISISVSPCERHQRPRLLNAVTSPHVLIRSAVRASCAIPGFFEPVQLMARDQTGRVVPFLRSRWIDGVFAADLPARQLARLYGANHYIVSYVNPVLLATFRDAKLESRPLAPLADLAKGAARQWLRANEAVISKYLPTSSVGVVNKVLQDVVSQDYVGDVNIAPRKRLHSPHRLLSPSTPAEIAELIREGERQTWPRLEMVRTATQISRTLDDILDRSEQSDERAASQR